MRALAWYNSLLSLGINVPLHVVLDLGAALLGERAEFAPPRELPRLPEGVNPADVAALLRDYAAVFKPALLATAEGGAIVCCNNVAQVERDGWLDGLRRSAAKAGRPGRDAEWITPEEVFPSPDGRHPLKMVLLRV